MKPRSAGYLHVRCRVPIHAFLAVLIAVLMIFTLERDEYAFEAHPVPYVLGAFLMWGLIAHFHWTRYKKEGDANSRIFAVLWALHILIGAALLIGLGWQTYFS